MSIAYMEVEKDSEHPEFDEVCPYDGSDLLISEYGDNYLCKENHHILTYFDVISRQTWEKLQPCISKETSK